MKSTKKYAGIISSKDFARELGISQKALRIRLSKGKLPNPIKREGDELFWETLKVKHLFKETESIV